MGQKQPEIPAAQSQSDIAKANLEAQLAYAPQAAKLGYDIQANPEYGAQATTQLYENIRKNVFPQESGVRSQLLQNILANLMSPTGTSPEQQASIEAMRGKTVGDYQTAIRNRQNLGGTLYGGRSIQEENRAVGDLYNQFNVEDVNREERARLNAIQAAIPALQILFPDINLMAPNFTSPVASPDTATQASTALRGQDIASSTATQQANAQMMSALFQALGSAAGGALTPK